MEWRACIEQVSLEKYYRRCYRRLLREGQDKELGMEMTFIYSASHPINQLPNQQALSGCYMPGTVLGTKYKMVNNSVPSCKL